MTIGLVRTDGRMGGMTDIDRDVDAEQMTRRAGDNCPGGHREGHLGLHDSGGRVCVRPSHNEYVVGPLTRLVVDPRLHDGRDNRPCILDGEGAR